MALDANGEVWAWANNEGAIEYGVLGRTTNPFTVGKVAGLNNIVSVSAQNAAATAVKKDGTVWVWGSNNATQLGNGKISDMPNRGRDSEVTFQPLCH